jgi:hypothetical protein
MIYPLASRLRVIADAGDRAPNHRTAVIHKTGIADSVATALFTVTTANETGSTDGGAYFCQVTALIGHSALSSAGSVAAKAFAARFTRAMDASGSGALSAVVEDHDDAPVGTDPASRSIGDVALTVVETSEYQVTASIQIDLSGTSVGTGQVVALVEVLWTGFVTAPEITPA